MERLPARVGGRRERHEALRHAALHQRHLRGRPHHRPPLPRARPHDPRRAAALWRTAEDAWSRAEARPDTDYTAAVEDAEGGGDYEDRGNSDDRYAAAAELYLTGHRRADPSTAAYRTAVTGSRHYREITRRFSWARTATTGTLSCWPPATTCPPPTGSG